jgi:filamentous hemagglutinin family protein
MKGCYLEKWLKVCSVFYALFSSNLSVAQVIGDTTLPVGERSQVTGNPNFQIDGGARRGGNLFHSFSEFSVSTGGTAYFNNAADVQNILARVTGGSISNINGLIRANGTANLFLLNPNGILFGAGASLNIGGSFVASSADRFEFNNGFAFSATNPQAPPLLTVNVPIGLQYGSNPGSVQVQGATLQVAPGQSLALLGGTVSINGGRLLAPEGRIELGGVAAEGSLGLQANGSSLRLSFSDAVGRADLFIDQQAELNVRGNDRGSIAINAHNIKISGNSRVRAGIELKLGSPQSQAGDIELNATGAVQVKGGSIIANNTGGQGNAGAVRINAQDFVSFDEVSQVQSGIAQGAVGNTGGIIINTGSLYLTNGGVLNSTNQQGQGNPGNILINARDTIVLDGPEDPKAPSQSASLIRSGVQSGGEGNGGDINITTGSLSLRNGGTLFSGLYSGEGNAGSININARDSITVDGGNRVAQLSGIRSNVFEGEGNSGNINIVTGSLVVKNAGVLNTNVQSLEGGSAGNININARDTVSIEGVSSTGDASRVLSDVSSQSGNGGDISITTRSLSVRNGAFVTTQTSGQGNGGNITINTNTIDAINGGKFITTTFGDGKAGNITVNATNSVNLSGSDPTFYARLTQLVQQFPDTTINAIGLSPTSGLFASTSETSTGRGGELSVNTRQFNIQDGARVTVSSSGTGSAGSLFVDANQIYLDNQGSIRADTSGGGGDINLRSPLILLRNGSNITTNATGSNIPGGNISIDTDNLVAVPNENSNISANSANFRGGNVTVRASGLFGIEFREQPTPLSDITATGATSEFSGTVDIITPGIDPARGLAELPTGVVDASDAIAQGCRGVQGSSFVVTGRGGLPPTPQQALGDDPRWRDWRTPAVVSRQPNVPANGTLSPSANLPSTKSAMVEATGWVTLPDGKVILTASAPNVTSLNRWGQPVNCDGS